MDKVAGIYKITSPSGKCYIGQSINIKNRMYQYNKLQCKSQTLLYKSIIKYGWENMKLEILWSSTDTTNIKEILNEFERDFIFIYDSIVPNGYNLREGGNSSKMSNETKVKMSQSKLNHIVSDGSKLKMSLSKKGKSFSEEHKLSLSIAKLNMNSDEKKIRSLAQLGSKKSDETKLKMSLSKKGKSFSEEHKLKVSLAKKGVPLTEEHKLKLRIPKKHKIVN